MDLNFVRWVAFAVAIVSIALCYRKNADHATLAVLAAFGIGVFSMAEWVIQCGSRVIH
jgi:hypothetical protein